MYVVRIRVELTITSIDRVSELRRIDNKQDWSEDRTLWNSDDDCLFQYLLRLRCNICTKNGLKLVADRISLNLYRKLSQTNDKLTSVRW